MIHLHFLASRFPPTRGGLEASTLFTAQMLRAPGSIEVTVYIRSDECDYGAVDEIEGIPIVALGPRRRPWEAPLINTDIGWRLRGERSRLDFLLMRNAVRAAVESEPDAAHALVSFFISTDGFVAQRVAEHLKLPHMACVRGTDFSLGFQSPDLFPAAAYVATTAAFVLTTNREQERAVRSLGMNRVRTVHTSVRPDVSGRRWGRRPCDGVVGVVSDCGYGYKKGTQVLLSAVASARAEGLRVVLTIAGETERDEEAYWSGVRRGAEQELDDAFVSAGFLSAQEFHDLLANSDIYASATLGEGSSLGRTAALVAGIPIVSTSCGELADVAAGASHVRIVPPGDAPAFSAALREAVACTLSGELTLDESLIETWRCHFSVEREREAWLECIHQTIAYGVGPAAARSLLRS